MKSLFSNSINLKIKFHKNMKRGSSHGKKEKKEVEEHQIKIKSVFCFLVFYLFFMSV